MSMKGAVLPGGGAGANVSSGAGMSLITDNRLVSSNNGPSTLIPTTRFRHDAKDLVKGTALQLVRSSTIQEIEMLKHREEDAKRMIKNDMARELTNSAFDKIKFTQRENPYTYTTEIIGRVWCFSEEELLDFIRRCRE